jgi:Zn-dependent oligopeptidase
VSFLLLWSFVFQLASILSYKNFAEYQLTLLCAKNPDNVISFLDRLSVKMRPLQKKEMDILLEYKRQEVCQIKIC